MRIVMALTDDIFTSVRVVSEMLGGNHGFGGGNYRRTGRQPQCGWSHE
jgi:hypothetical protein